MLVCSALSSSTANHGSCSQYIGKTHSRHFVEREDTSQNEVLCQDFQHSNHCPQTQTPMAWHVRHMEDGRLPKDIFYGERASSKCSAGRPLLRFIDVSKSGMIACGMDDNQWECLEKDRSAWKREVHSYVRRGEECLFKKAEEKGHRKIQAHVGDQPGSTITCDKCARDCHLRTGVYNNKRSCRQPIEVLRVPTK